MLTRIIQSAINTLGYEIRRNPKTNMPAELTPEERAIIDYVKSNGLTLVSYERLWTTLMACKHVIEQKIEGDFVECGVWRGGNALVAAELFKLHGVANKVWLFDTFAGMTEPTASDVSVFDGKAAQQRHARDQRETHNEWCYASLDDVKNSFSKKGLISDNVIFVKGDVCQTLKNTVQLPTKISVLRLDTDWYESTKMELDVLYPKLSLGGCLIIDDYGYWAGSKKATDEYFESHGNRPFLQYTDDSGRVGVKVA